MKLVAASGRRNELRAGVKETNLGHERGVEVEQEGGRGELTLIMTTLRARPLPASRLGLGSCLLRMGLAERAVKPSRRLLIEGEGERGGEEDETEEKESSL